MNKLRSVKDVWDELSEVDTTDEVALGIIQAERDAGVQRCADAAGKAWHDGEQRPCWLSDITNAILAVAQPTETTRERLGRVAYEAHKRDTEKPDEGQIFLNWHELRDRARESYMYRADAVCAELAKIQEEQKL